MAKPQIENGYTRISNELLEALSFVDMPSTAWRIFLFILRKTYGYGKKEDRIAVSQILKATHISERRVWDCLAWLKEHNMVYRDQGTKMTGIIKDYSSWSCLSTYPHPAQIRRVLKSAVPPAQIRTPSPLLKSAGTKEIYKRNSYKRKATAVDNSKDGKVPYLEGDRAWQDPKTKQWRVKIHTGEWMDYIGDVEKHLEWR